MIKVILLLVYLTDGQLKIEQKAFETDEACQAAGHARVEQMVKDPHFDQGLFAACVPSLVTEAKK